MERMSQGRSQNNSWTGISKEWMSRIEMVSGTQMSGRPYNRSEDTAPRNMQTIVLGHEVREHLEDDAYLDSLCSEASTVSSLACASSGSSATPSIAAGPAPFSWHTQSVIPRKQWASEDLHHECHPDLHRKNQLSFSRRAHPYQRPVGLGHGPTENRPRNGNHHDQEVHATACDDDGLSLGPGNPFHIEISKQTDGLNRHFDR